VVAQAAGGETVTITDRGRPVAQLTPIPSSTLQSLLAAGLGRAARRDIAALTAPDAGAVLTRELAAMRDAERS
jgi:antitoxin (DNA-binding transcriptional repressor) of toxin-antitoxin stability system